MLVVNDVTPAFVNVTVLPKETAPPPLIPVPAVTVTDELVNFAFDIEPANIPSVTFNAPIVVVFPTEETSPLKFAFVVTVAAFPEILPCNEPVKAVDVNDVKPAIVVDVPPKDVDVEPIVIAELVNLPFATDNATNCEPSIVLLVSV